MEADKSQLTLTIVFDPPFYKAIFESISSEKYEVAQVNLGTSDPKLALIFDLVTHHWNSIHFFSKDTKDSIISIKNINPKRKQRLVRKQLKRKVTGTKAQNALKKHFDDKKVKAKKIKRKRKKDLREQKFRDKLAKRKIKHKGH